MQNQIEPQLETKEAEDLYRALASIDWSKNIAKFLRDILTIDEMEEMIRRFWVAKLLEEGKTVRTIVKETGVSSATISRINYWLHHGMGGYSLALEKLKV